MSFSRLLLVAANSRKCIYGQGNSKVCISPKFDMPNRDRYEGEVILCFQLDEKTDRGKQVPFCLGIPVGSKRCDGLVFYSEDDKPNRVICLVEMKSTEITGADDQLISTKSHISDLLHKECEALPIDNRSACEKQIDQIKWIACFYHTGASQKEVLNLMRTLKNSGFDNVGQLYPSDNDLRSILSGEDVNAKELAKRLRSRKKR